METPNYSLYSDRNIQADEFDALMSSTGWGNDGFFNEDVLAQHFSRVTHAAYVRDESGKLVGYISSIYNGFASNFIDTMAIQPDVAQDEVGRLLLEEITRQTHGFPLYAMPFADQQEMFYKQGFRIPGRPMISLSKKNQDDSETSRTCEIASGQS